MALRRTLEWAQRCIAEHRRITTDQPERAYQALFGVIQGAQYEDLRRQEESNGKTKDTSGQVIYEPEGSIG